MYMLTRGSIKPWALAAGTRRGALISGFSRLGAFFLLSMANSMATSTIEAIAKMRYLKCTVHSLRSRRSLPLAAADNRYNRRYRLQGPAATHGACPLLRMALARQRKLLAHCNAWRWPADVWRWPTYAWRWPGCSGSVRICAYK
jgi:hypothetical protein